MALRFARLAAWVAAITLVAGSALAQGFPSSIINLMVAYPAGGLLDAIAHVASRPTSMT